MEVKMNKDFSEKLKEYLDSECDDYDLSYKWDWIEDCNFCEVIVTRLDYTSCINFKYENNDLAIELSEDSYYKTRWWESSVKYFWMLISPDLFPK